MDRHVFISYRTDDGIDKATALARDLDALFGDEQVFLDKKDLAAGSRWREEIARTIGTRPILLVLVTPHYLDAVDRAGRRRIERDDDPVRLELSAALAAGAHVVPLLCDGVDHTPDAATLPAPFDQLGELTWRRLRAYDWREDVARLAGDLERLGVERRGAAAASGGEPAAAGVAAAGGAAAAGAAGTVPKAGADAATGAHTGRPAGAGRDGGASADTGTGTGAGRDGGAHAGKGGSGARDEPAGGARAGSRRRFAFAAVAVAAAAGSAGWLAWRQPDVASRSPSHPLAPVSLPRPASVPPMREAVVPPAPVADVPPARDADAAPRRDRGTPPARGAATLPPAERDAATPPPAGLGDARQPSADARGDVPPAAPAAPATASAALMSGRWTARLGAPGAASATGGKPLAFDVVQDGDRLRLTSDAIDVDRDPEWQDYRAAWRQRHPHPLLRVRWRGEGDLVADPGGPKRVSIAMRVEAAATGEAIDAGRLTGWVGDAGRRIEGRLRLDGGQGERPVVLRMRSALLPGR